jgi:undecaprenyl-diphosphatase
VLLLKALALGIVEGLTEFLPISSTGHLIVAGAVLDFPEDKRVTFDIFIQLGATVAVFWHYRRDLARLAAKAFSGHRERGLLLKVLLAFLPAAAAGLFFHRLIEEQLFTASVVAAAMAGGGLAILLIERRTYRPRVLALESTGWREAALIGMCQVAALLPGVSRAAATILGGLLVGLSRPVATEFSFYLALPTLTAASLFSLLKSLSALTAADMGVLAVGFGSAFFSALSVIRLFLAYVKKHDFRVFGYYRIAAGLAVYWLGVS